MADSDKILVFELSGEKYGIEVLDVKEIVKAVDKEITNIPESSDFIKGITNLRGNVIPVLDLEEKFGLEKRSQDYMIIIEIEGSNGAVMVDGVQQVMSIPEERIKDAPEVLKDEIHNDYIDKVALLEDETMITILDLKKGLGKEETTEIGEMSEKRVEEEVEEVSENEIEQKAREKVS